MNNIDAHRLQSCTCHHLLLSALHNEENCFVYLCKCVRAIILSASASASHRGCAHANQTLIDLPPMLWLSHYLSPAAVVTGTAAAPF